MGLAPTRLFGDSSSCLRSLFFSVADPAAGFYFLEELAYPPEEGELCPSSDSSFSGQPVFVLLFYFLFPQQEWRASFPQLRVFIDASERRLTVFFSGASLPAVYLACVPVQGLTPLLFGIIFLLNQWLFASFRSTSSAAPCRSRAAIGAGLPFTFPLPPCLFFTPRSSAHASHD